MCVSALRAFVPGIYPRSAELVAATRDLDRGRTTAAAVAGQVERDRLALVAAQQEAGFELIVDGMLDWQDLFRPLAERCEGVEARPLTRFLDTNTFFRALLVSGTPRLREPLPVPVLPGDWLGTLPSPYALARAAGGAVAAEVWAANVLAPQVEAWASAGAHLIVLDEPFLAREPDGLDELAAGLAALPAACPLVLRLPFGDAGPLLPRLLELPLFGIGVDFHATALEALPRPFPAFLYAGVVDVRSSIVEDAISVARFVAELGSLEPHGIALGPNGDLQFVAEPIARRKLERLGQAQRALAEAA
jgi:5-methyltetrahydropteroyltriglutamate--homocysteine methyltransferase